MSPTQLQEPIIKTQKVSKHKKMKNLQDAVVNLLATQEGCSALLTEALESILTITPKEHVYQPNNDWEVKS